MATYDGRALRAQLQADFATLAHGIRDATVLNEIYEALTGTVLRTMRDLLNQWNHGRAVERLPPEVLVSVFVWLPFRERVRVAHVSRSWRAASVNFPSVWADINITGLYRDKHRLLDMALSRTGEHPVDLEIELVHPVDNLVTTALKKHTHHIRTFKWSSEHGRPPNASLPAPMLETWQSDVFSVPADFLGGQCGKLRTLHVKQLYLPETCPALSTLTELVIDSDGATDEQSAATLTRMFALCPALQLLIYCNMPAGFAHLLPSGQAPASLTRLTLRTCDDGYDLMQHYLAWRTDALKYVVLDMAYGMSPNREPVLSGAHELRVIRDAGTDEPFATIITAYGPGRAHSVGIADSPDEQVRLAALLLGSCDALSHVHTLRIGLYVLDAYVELFAVLPALRHVVIYLKSDNFVDAEGAEPQIPAPHVFPGDLITGLVRLHTDRPALESLVIRVAQCWDRTCPVNADDARNLVAQLQLLQDRTFPEIYVKGFSPDIVRAVEVPHGYPEVVFILDEDS